MAKTMAFLVAFVVLLSLDYFVSAEALAKGGMKTSHWTGRQQTSASSPELFPNCRSKLECAVRCRRFSHCAAFTFDRESRTCSLFPVQKPEVSPEQSQTVYWNTDPVCAEAEIGNGTTSWNSTLTSLEGDVTCNTDFMYTSVDTALRCRGDGTWEPPIGQCLQYYWRNTTGDFLLPRQIFPGWAVCVEGKPTANSTFRGGAMTSTLTTLFWRFVLCKDLVTDRMTVKMDEKMPVKGTIQPFPFRVGLSFNVSIVLLSADHTYSLVINGQEFMQRTSVQPINDVMQVFFDGDVELEYINIWCV